ncbi:HD domain-containing phosphohydrolase [Acetobacterium sp.]|uniref:HD domain-containing phosphohydrolase n=1 Tax=Acetobacterium sp. TaxID=1872094 RepID=UPI002F424E67
MKQMIKRFYIVGVVVTITVALGMFIEFKYFEHTIMEQTQANILLERDAVASDICSRLGNMGQVITDAGSYTAIETDESKILDYLKALETNNPSFISLYFGTPDNKMINSSGFVPLASFDLRTRPWYIKVVASDQLIFTEPFVNATKDQLIVTVAKPVYNVKHEFLGVIAGDISIHSIINLVLDKNSSEEQYSFLIDGKGNILAHPYYIYNETSDLVNINAVSENLSAAMIQNKTGSTAIVLNGIPGYLAYQPIVGTDWTVGSFMGTAEYVKTALQALVIFLLSLLSSGFIIFVILILQKRYILQPLLKLDMDIQGISIEDNVAYRMKAENDTFGVIRKSVNNVLEKTQNYFDELNASKEALVISEERNRAIVNALPDSVFILDGDGRFIDFHVNDESFLILRKGEFMGKTLVETLPGDLAIKGNKDISQALQTGNIQMFEYCVNFPDGNHYLEIRTVKSSEDEVIVIARDITEKKNNQIYIEYLSYHDQLTGLYNRRFYEEEIIRLDTEENLPLTIALLDVNGLKLTNDAFGHLAGDILLKKLADLLKKECRFSDVISRIGGDEFTILFPKTTSAEVSKIVERVYKAASKTDLENSILSVSIGWETKTAMDQSMDELFIKAEDHMYRKKLVESKSMRNQTLQAITKKLNYKNEREKKHSDRVSIISKKIGEAMHLDYEVIKEIEIAGLLHDIGKIAVSDDILNKPGKLTEAEYYEIKKHPEVGYQILKSVDAYSSIAEFVLAHHERLDGKGYPLGLTATKIPFIAKIIAVADSFEAMASDRTYGKALGHDKIIKELRRHSGTQFDPEIVKVLIDLILNDTDTTRD